ncbi:MAG: triose-phosphate isomerase [Candidatus Nanoarchaeia archaeon]|nr:triose-phosphate isomerase [Candidatus Nanoarchaeia archaeon]MDD5741066.1 triose-phosphate isomerase [Candidatus Nanoarchaeia archaeon]
MKPLVVINFKTYKQGKDAIELAKKIDKIDKNIIIGVQASDIYEITKATKLAVYSQHVDYEEKGRATGFILPEAVKKDKAVGSFLNHSEHKLSFDVLKGTMKRCKQAGLKTMVFASSVKEALKIEKLKPDYLVYEPPELVGGRISVSESKPDVIKKLSERIKMKFLVGAGIHNSEDVEIAVKLGAIGFAVSSAVVNAKEPEKKLRELISNP